MRKCSHCQFLRNAIPKLSRGRAAANASSNLPLPSQLVAVSRSPTGILFFFTLLGVGSLTGLSGCKKAAPAAPPPPIVEVMEIKTTNAPSSVEFIGSDSFAHYHAVHPSVIGMVRFAGGIVQGNVNANMAADFEIKVAATAPADWGFRHPRRHRPEGSRGSSARPR